MEPNESRSLDWKTCFKKILAPHLLNSSEEQNDAPHPLNPTYSEEQNDACQNIVNPKNDSVSTTAFLNNPEKSENVQKNINSSITVESVHTDDSSQSFIDGCQDSGSPGLNDAENPVETEENVANIIAADAEKLAKSFTALKVKKKDKYFHNMAVNSRNASDWNIAFKKVLDPKSVPESSLKTPEEFADEKPYLSHPELLDSGETNPWIYHRLCKKDEHLENMEEVAAQSLSENCNKERHYSEEEKKVLEILRQARTFKRPKKPHMNIFDGAGVNCFKDSEIKSSTKNRSSNTKKPKNVPPPGGWVCVKPVTLEEARKRPPNIISTECWDWDEDDW
ncbi:hypothetical protein AVEN_145425-1 [Araneus ventricosus]|uniref:Uncharacterized protein n=1 Tax=Araneus ventricosus TaxID=182803 RepID=A0A4Y2H7V2_ARAVE|nr:hypothetical protein AVEN_145425-1 [Araneus ventricosus]